MNDVTHLEHSASSSRGKHEGEPSFGLCDRLSRTRDNSQRQLPTDHDYAVSTREYQTDQSSLKSAPAAARSVLGKQQKQRQKQTRRFAELTRSLHIRPTRSSASFRMVCLNAESRRSTKCYKKLNSAETLIQRTTSEAPQRRYVLHRT